MAKYTKEQVMQMVRENNVRFIRLQFTDILGSLKNVAITDKQLEKALKNDCMFDGSSIEGFVRIEESDMRLYPDLDSFVIYPWTPKEHTTKMTTATSREVNSLLLINMENIVLALCRISSVRSPLDSGRIKYRIFLDCRTKFSFPYKTYTDNNNASKKLMALLVIFCITEARETEINPKDSKTFSPSSVKLPAISVILSGVIFQ